MKKGKIRIILGSALVILQIMSFLGNAKAGIGIQISFDSLGLFIADIIYLVSYCFVGIIGTILLISGARDYVTGEPEEPIEEETVPEEEEEIKGFTIPLSTIMPILLAIFVVILAIVLILERRNHVL